MPSRGGRHRAESGQSRQRGRAELLRVIELDPHEVGVRSANWTTELLAEYLGKQTGIQVTEETVRVHLHANGYVCKRPTWTLRRKAEAQAGYVGKDCG
jgi:transposase